MIRYYKIAIKDILQNKFLSIVSIVTIALSIFIVSAFGLFFLNTNDMMRSWQKGVRIMAYLTPESTGTDPSFIKNNILGLYGVASAEFISKADALNLLKEQMKQQSSLLSDLTDNPLPDAFEIRMTAAVQTTENIETLVKQLKAIPSIDDVEYGQRWLGRFAHIFYLFRIAGYAICCLFFMATAFIVANTIRLVLYSRREEVEIMRLVGATDMFIQTPFYIEGLIHGAVGGILGLVVLFVLYLTVSVNVIEGLSSGFFHIRFFPVGIVFTIIIGSMVIGWLGCFLSLRQFLKA